jgi:hypothetical protein
MQLWNVTVSAVNEQGKILSKKTFLFSKQPERGVLLQQSGDYFTC